MEGGICTETSDLFAYFECTHSPQKDIHQHTTAVLQLKELRYESYTGDYQQWYSGLNSVYQQSIISHTWRKFHGSSLPECLLQSVDKGHRCCPLSFQLLWVCSKLVSTLACTSWAQARCSVADSTTEIPLCKAPSRSVLNLVTMDGLSRVPTTMLL